MDSKNVLFVCTFGDFLTSFELSNISIYQEMGYTIHCASNFSIKERNVKNNILKKMGCILHNVEFERNPSFRMLKNIKDLRKIIKDNNISVIDTHNAVCSALVRIAAKKEKVKKVIYTPHSLFFFKGCPKKNIIIYKPIEHYLAKYTDLMILINKEDYESSKKMKLRGKSIYVPGIGIDMDKILSSPKIDIRKEFNIDKNKIIILSIGELNGNKNHESVIRALYELKSDNYIYVICGMGELEEYYKKLLKELNMEDKVIFTGFRTDVYSILKESDVFIFPSFREGLSAALMEAMTCGKFCICSNIRGNVDLINKNNGMLFNPNSIDEIKKCLKAFLANPNEYKKIGLKNSEIVKKCDLKNVHKIMVKEYDEFLNE